jgi:hypothetical protein
MTKVVLVLSLALIACSDPAPVAPPPATPVATPPAEPAVAPTPEPAPAPATAPTAEGPTPIVAQPIPTAQRLAPCRVELTHTEYDEETRAPTATRRPVSSIARVWMDSFRDNDFAESAPLPLTLEQARAANASNVSEIGGRPVFRVDTGDGMLSYSFDAQGRTDHVDLDPVADSSDYRYQYQYQCEADTIAPTFLDDVEGLDDGEE